jgi:hypothetical protein
MENRRAMRLLCSAGSEALAELVTTHRPRLVADLQTREVELESLELADC